MKVSEKALLAAKIIKERKANNPILFKVGKLSSIADYFLIASGNSNRQVQSICRHLVRKMREQGFKTFGIEGEPEGHWILIDYGDLIIHIFFEPVRDYYDLEGLWIEAPRVNLDENNIMPSQ